MTQQNTDSTVITPREEETILKREEQAIEGEIPQPHGAHFEGVREWTAIPDGVATPVVELNPDEEATK